MELLIRIVSRHSGDKEVDKRRLQKGHVVAARPDGWQWSEREKNNPEWVIVRAPITAIERDSLLATGQNKIGSGATHKRRSKLDLDALGVSPSNDVKSLPHQTFASYTQSID